MEVSVMDEMPKIVVIGGPTAVGKTGVTIRVAERIYGEVVNADSMQIYRYMNIGTAKPTPEERRRIAHHMIDVADPDESYDAARFSLEARKAADGVLKRHRVPLVAGGTGFYIRAFLYGLCDAAPEDPAIRVRLREEAGRSGAESMHRKLAACDPEAAGKIHPNDIYRIVRALEVYETCGIPLTEFRRRHAFADAPYESLSIVLDMDRTELYERIDRRVDRMVAEGLAEEVERLFEMGYDERLKPMQSLGYRHMGDYIRGRVDRDTAVETLKRDTRHYAKRQLTWFRKDPQALWFSPAQTDRIAGAIGAFLERK